MRRGAIDLDKVVIWVIGLLVLLAIIAFIYLQLAPGRDNLMCKALDMLKIRDCTPAETLKNIRFRL